MKGVILAGGLGTRLYPLTHATNKHLLPVYDRPMICYPIQTLVKARVDNILIVIGGPHAGDFIPVLKDGKSFGIRHMEYAYQEKGDGGIADALRLAENFADHDSLTVILGDNCTDTDISSQVKSFQSGATIFLKEVSDPQRFGIPEFDKSDPKKIIALEEKPSVPKSNLAITGLYIYDNKVFDYIRQIQLSARAQLEITDVNKLYLQAGQLQWSHLDGFWSDAGTFESLYRTGEYWAKKVLN